MHVFPSAPWAKVSAPQPLTGLQGCPRTHLCIFMGVLVDIGAAELPQGSSPFPLGVLAGVRAVEVPPCTDRAVSAGQGGLRVEGTLNL